MSDSSCQRPLDPRIRRTRDLLQQALAQLLLTRCFDDISVQEITDAATVNRATFYAHYPDKFALLECLVAGRFLALLEARGVAFSGTCPTAIQGIVLGLCDYLAGSPIATQVESQRQLGPHLEAALIAVAQRMLLDGMQRHPPAPPATPELLSAMLAGAMYAAAKDWVAAPGRPPATVLAADVFTLLAPLLNLQPSQQPGTAPLAAAAAHGIAQIGLEPTRPS